MLDWRRQPLGCLLQMSTAASSGVIFMSVNTNDFDVQGDLLVVSGFFFYFFIGVTSSKQYFSLDGRLLRRRHNFMNGTGEKEKFICSCV